MVTVHMRWQAQITGILIFKVSRINAGSEVQHFVQITIVGEGEGGGIQCEE